MNTITNRADNWKLPLEYIVTPVYDLSMTLIIGSLCKNGILVSGDKRGHGFIQETGETIISNKLRKIFTLDDRIIYGYAGKNVKDPKDFASRVNRKVTVIPDTVAETASLLLEMLKDYHDEERFDGYKIMLLVAGYDLESTLTEKDGTYDLDAVTKQKTEPVIYLGLLDSDNKHTIKQGNYLSIGKPDIANNILSSLDTITMEVDELSIKHNECFTQTSKHDESVSEENNSFYITKDGIKEL